MLLHNEPLSKYTSWRVGGPAKNLFLVDTLENLQDFLKNIYIQNPQEKIIWIGLGSNLLVRDKGFDGTIIITQGGLNKIENINNHIIKFQAGVACGTAARHSARLGLAGIEFLAGVPGTIGGALAMNAGAHGNETWDFVESCDVINKQGEIKNYTKSHYKISYRQVICPEKDEWFIAGYFKLIADNKEKSLLKIKELLAHRAKTQPINLPNCGSVFRNPENNYAAKLIENCNLKGFKIGDAEVSEKHANFIINNGQASAKDIELLINHVHQIVLEKTGIDLIREVHIIGEN